MLSFVLSELTSEKNECIFSKHFLERISSRGISETQINITFDKILGFFVQDQENEKYKLLINHNEEYDLILIVKFNITSRSISFITAYIETTRKRLREDGY